MAQFHRYLIASFILLVPGMPLHVPPDAAAEETWNFAVFASEPPASLCYIPTPDAAPVRLTFYPTARSPRYQYEGRSPLQLLDSATGEVVAHVPLATGLQVALVILTPNMDATGGALRYKVRVVDDDGLRHRPGELLILNASGLTLKGTINRRSVTLRDGENQLVAVGPSANINLRTPFREQTYQSFADTICLEPSARALLLLLPPYHRGSLEVQSRVLLDAPANDVPADSD